MTNSHVSSVEVSAPPSIALAWMAWKLAWLREHGTTDFPRTYGPHPRRSQYISKASPEYYLIIDRLARGEQP